MNNPIKYINGDVREPIGLDQNLIIHCCNDIGRMGSGVALALMKKWPVIRNQYITWYNEDLDFKLGDIQIVKVSDSNDIFDTFVANMIGQHGINVDKDGNPPVRYKAIRKCLKSVCKYCLKNNTSVHAPKFGSDLAGGDWNIIEKIIEEELTNKGVSVTVYEWEG